MSLRDHAEDADGWRRNADLRGRGVVDRGPVLDAQLTTRGQPHEAVARPRKRPAERDRRPREGRVRAQGLDAALNADGRVRAEPQVLREIERIDVADRLVL